MKKQFKVYNLFILYYYMVLYECDVCNFITILKGNYKQHLNTKKHLTNNEISLSAMVKTPKDPKKTQKDPKKTQKDPLFFCDYCNMIFSSYAHKRRHEIHRCKENSSIKDKKIKILEKEKKKLEKKIEKMMDKVCTINNTTNNNTNNIVIVNNYGKENTDYLTAEKISKLLDRPYDSIQDLIKMLHFNVDHPENHNVKITNKKEPFALVWNNPIWELRKKKSVVKDMVDKGYMMIDTTHDEVSYDDNDSYKTNKKYLKFQNNFENNNSNIKELIEEETEIVIFNESKKIE
jgi:hypothetical protein